jgi:multimeric flavodoxin WrbA
VPELNQMLKVLAVLGSPRRGGNTEILLDEAIRGAGDRGAEAEKVVLADLKISPCMEIYACKKKGICPIKDDMLGLYEKLDECPRVILASPIFFYSVSATAKAFIDRCQARWARRYVLGQRVSSAVERRGAFISVGATSGKRLFEGVRLTVKYFFDAIDMVYAEELLIRGVDEKGEILKHPEYLEQAYELGKRMAVP